MKHLLLLIVFTLNIYSQSYDLKLVLTKGHTYFHNSISKISIIQKIEGQELHIKSTLSGKMSFKVIRELDSKYELEVMYNSLDIATETPKGLMSFSSENVNFSDDVFSTVFSAILSKAKNRPFLVTMYKNGIVEKIKGVDTLWSTIYSEFPNITDLQKEQINTQLKQAFGEKAFKGSIEMVTAIFPNKKVRINEEWKTSIHLESGMSGNIQNTIKLKSYNSDFANIEVNSVISTDDKEAYVKINGMPAKYDLSGKMYSEIKINSKSGWIRNAKITQNLEGEVKIKDTYKIGLLDWKTVPMEMTTEMEANGVIVQENYASIEDYDTLINISKKLALNNNTDRAIAVLKKALKIDSTRIEAYYGLGYCYTQNCYENKLNCDKGIHYLNICIEKDKNYRNALFNRATCKSNLGNLKGALVDLNNAIKKDSTDSDYFMNRAWVKLQLKDTVGTCLDYKRAIKLGEVKGNKRFKNVCTQK